MLKIFRLIKRFWIYPAGAILLLTFIILLITIGLHFLEPWSFPKNLLISNLADSQATVSWTTDKITRSVVIVSEDGKFPLLPVFVGENLFKDDGEKYLKTAGFYTTHHFTITGLKTEKVYRYRIYQGWRKIYQGNFKTGPVSVSLGNPNPVYGRVLSADKKPIPAALVYLWVVRESTSSGKQASGGAALIEKSSLLSALTNADGRWSLDLGNLRTGSLKNVFIISKNSLERLVIEGGSQGRFKAEATLGKDKPWPDVILKQVK